MKFSDIVNQASTLLESAGRITYRALKREFDLDDEALEDLREELIIARQVARDENDKVLVWAGVGEHSLIASSSSFTPVISSERPSPTADRRQLTVMFCDLVGSTPMSAQLDPEDYRDIMQAYQEMCGQVLARFTGHIARYEGDGILVYFGYPQAQEDAAAQAVRASLHILAELPTLNARFQPRFPLLQDRPLQVRIGLHTGLVVVGEMGSEQYRIDIAVGETPNMAARIQGQAGPNEIMISAATYQLVEGLFECEELEPRTLKGIASPQSVYQVRDESEAHNRFQAAIRRGLTPFVGREQERGLLQERWARAKNGEGQAVLLSGEAGIGKSRLVQFLKEQALQEEAVCIEFRCSPYHQNSPLYPITTHLRRILQFAQQDSPESKLQKLENGLSPYRFPQPDTVPLLAAVLSLPPPAGYPPLNLSPQRQRQKTHEVLVSWLGEEAERSVLYCAWEDLHWADPATLELLSLGLDQVPTARMLFVLTFRPEFVPPWPTRSHLSPLVLSRLGSDQVGAMVENVTHRRRLPTEVLQHIITKTDGVPLFVEELTKMVLESGLLRENDGQFELTEPLPALAIPTTLQDSLMARLDRLASAKEVAQLGAILGREFSYELLQAVSSVNEETLRNGLAQLVDAELIYQRGLPPHARYIFKHALVQDTAYQSLLKRERQRLHRHIAEVLQERFPVVADTQPELVAHHFTESGIAEQAIPYWQRAGEKALDAANVEAIGYLTKGIALLDSLSDTTDRARQEWSLQTTLGLTFMTTKSYAASEVEAAYTRARALCQQIGEGPELGPVLYGLWIYHLVRGELQTAHDAAEQLLRLGQQVSDPAFEMEGHHGLGQSLYFMGEFSTALEHLEQAIALYDAQAPESRPIRPLQHAGVMGRGYAAWSLWHLGYPDQALQRVNEALALAQELAHPFSAAMVLNFSSALHEYRGARALALQCREEMIAYSEEQGFPQLFVIGTFWRSFMRVTQGQVEEGLAQMYQDLATYQAIRAELGRPALQATLAAVHGAVGQAEEEHTLLTEATALMETTGQWIYAVTISLLRGSALLRAGDSNIQEAEQCLQHAYTVARQQQAKSLELRAVISLCRLWHRQGKNTEARELLAETYNWFTEGFDTKDLQEAKTLLEELR